MCLLKNKGWSFPEIPMGWRGEIAKENIINIRVIRIELIISTWKVEVIPFNYTRFKFTFIFEKLVVKYIKSFN
jgi:hypothetical protein